MNELKKVVKRIVLTSCCAAAITAAAEKNNWNKVFEKDNCDISFNSGHSTTVAKIPVKKSLDVNEYSKFKLRVEMSMTADTGAAGLRLKFYGDDSEFIDEVGCGKLNIISFKKDKSGQVMDHAKAGENISVCEEVFDIAEYANFLPRTIPGIREVELILYRHYKKGLVKIKKIELFVLDEPRQETSKLVADLKTQLKKDNFKLLEKDNILIASSPEEIRYYKMKFAKRAIAKSFFDNDVLLGTTYLKRKIKAPYFPAGACIYVDDRVPAILRKRNINMEQYLELNAKDMIKHNCNTIHYSYLSGIPKLMFKAAEISRKNGVKIFTLQNSGMYLRPHKPWDFYRKVTQKAAERYLPKYKDIKGVAGWSGKEEIAPNQVEMTQDYRNFSRKLLGPKQKIYTLHNNIKSIRIDNRYLPDWFAYDSYRFRTISPQMAISTPKDTALFASKLMQMFHDAAAQKGIPMFCVIQGYNSVLDLKNENMPRKSGFIKIYKDLYRGVRKYTPPEHGMSLQSWIAVSTGMKGVIVFPYYDFEINPKKYQASGMLTWEALVSQAGVEHRIWKEFGECMGKIKPFRKLIIDWFHEGYTFAKTDNSEIKVDAFRLQDGKSKFYTLVNTRIAKWDKTSPRRPDNKTNLCFGNGTLLGLEKVGPISFNFTPENDLPLWDLETGEKLSRKFEIAPGGGMILMQGTEKEMRKIRKIYIKGE